MGARHIVRLRGALAAGAAMAALFAGTAWGQSARPVSTQAQPLKGALEQVARQTGTDILFAPDVVAGVAAPAVNGQYTAEDAVRLLLEGTPLRVVRDQAGALIVKRRGSVLPTSDEHASRGPESSGESNTSQLEEVIVTAQRRAERLQDVPIAVTALSSAELQRQHITDVKSLSAVAPSLYTGGAVLDSSVLAVSIRGINSLSETILQDPGVGVYLNDVYVPRTNGANLATIDLKQVEILRGPQGTLFGRNTIGGAITLTTNPPTDHFEASVEGTLGNYKERDFTGIVSGPIVEGKLDARLVFAHQEHEGYVRDTFLDTRQGGNDTNYARLSLRATPSDIWTISVVGDMLKAHIGSLGGKILNITPGSLTTKAPAASGNPTDSIANYVGGDLLTNQANYNPDNRLSVADVAATITGSFGAATFKDIIGFRHMRVDRSEDIDGTPYDIVNDIDSPANSNVFTNEAQLFGTALNDRLHWIGGLYYLRETGGNTLAAEVLPAITHARSTNIETAKNISYAAFAQATYEILPRLKLTGGVRYTYDKRSAQWISTSRNLVTQVVTCTLPPTLQIAPGTCESTEHSAHFHYVPYTLKLEYHPTEDVNLYGSYSVGYRSGGFPSAGGAVAQAYLPIDTEKTKTSELGVKAQWLDGRLRTNLAGYNTDYTNIQLATLQFTSQGVPFSSVINSGSGRLRGAELEVTALLGQLELNGSYGVIHAKYLTGPYLGRPFLIVPHQTASIGATYPVDTALGRLTLHADYNWRTRVQFQYNSPQGTLGYQLDGSKALGLLNASIALDLKRTPATLEVWVKNLGDRRYVTWVSDQSASLGGEYGIPAAPRTFGVTARYRFGD